MNNLRWQFSAVPLIAMLAAAFLARPASADFLYDVKTAFGTQTHQEFTEPSLLTSLTTVSSFLLNTSTGAAVTSLALDPVPSGSCPPPTGLSGPCLVVDFQGGGQTSFGGFPTFTSVGTFTNNSGGATITISNAPTAAPEPRSAGFLLGGLGVMLFAWKKRFLGQYTGSR